MSALLLNHGARLVKYVGRWSIEDRFPPGKEENVDAEATRGLGYEPALDGQQPGQTRQQSDSTWSQDWGREQAGQVSGQQSGRITGKDVDHAVDMTDSSEGAMQDEDDEQEGSEDECRASSRDQHRPIYGETGLHGSIVWSGLG